MTQGRQLKELSVKELANLIPNTEASSKAHFNSRCDQTMVGMVQRMEAENYMTSLEITCFFAERVRLNHQFEDFVQIEEEKVQTLEKVTSTVDNKLMSKWSRGKRVNLFQQHRPSPEMDSYISWINQQNLSWKANLCMLSEDHPEYTKCENRETTVKFLSLAQEGELTHAENQLPPNLLKADPKPASSGVL